MSRKFTGDTDIAFPCLETINGADIVESSASNERAGRCVGTGHDPTRSKWDSMHLVSCISIPNNQFSILWSWDQVTWWICSPMHGVYFGQVTSKCSSGSHLNSTDRFHIGRSLNKCCITCCFPCILVTIIVVSEQDKNKAKCQFKAIRFNNKNNVPGSCFWGFLLLVSSSPTHSSWIDDYNIWFILNSDTQSGS